MKKINDILLKIGWIGFSLIAVLFSTCQALMLKYLTKKKMGPSQIIILSIIIFQIVLILTLIIINNKIKDYIPKYSAKYIFLVFVTGLFTFFTYYSFLKGIELAPNPGYPMAIQSISYVAVTIIACYYFKSEINKKKILGIVAIIVGLILMVF